MHLSYRVLSLLSTQQHLTQVTLSQLKCVSVQCLQLMEGDPGTEPIFESKLLEHIDSLLKHVTEMRGWSLVGIRLIVVDWMENWIIWCLYIQQFTTVWIHLIIIDLLTRVKGPSVSCRHVSQVNLLNHWLIHSTQWMIPVSSDTGGYVLQNAVLDNSFRNLNSRVQVLNALPVAHPWQHA